MQVPLWGPLGGSLCRWPCYNRRIARGMCQEALDLERSNGGERTESKCRKDKDHDLWYRPGPLAEFRWVPCAICCTGVGSNSIFCNCCKHWVHKKCSGLKPLTKDPDYRCTQCQGTACPLDGRPQGEVQVGPDKLEVVASFCCFLLLPRRHPLSSWWLWTFNHVWKLPGRSSRSCYQFSLPATSLSRHVAACTGLVCGAQCSMPVRLGHWQSQTSNICSEMTGQWSDRSAMSGCKTLTPPDLMSILSSLALSLILKEWRLRWYGHVERSNGAVKTAFDLQFDGNHGPGRPKMTWKQLIERDCREWKLLAISPHDRHTWRSGARSAMRAASQLPGRGPTDVDVAPVPAC